MALGRDTASSRRLHKVPTPASNSKDGRLWPWSRTSLPAPSTRRGVAWARPLAIAKLAIAGLVHPWIHRWFGTLYRLGIRHLMNEQLTELHLFVRRSAETVERSCPFINAPSSRAAR